MSYYVLALRTEGDDPYVRQDQFLEELDDAHLYRSRLLHASLGLSDEQGEFSSAVLKLALENKPFDVINIIEELGELRWYCALLDSLLGVIDYADVSNAVHTHGERFLDVSTDTFWQRIALELSVAVGDLVGHVKAVTYYGKALNTYLLQARLRDILRLIQHAANKLGFGIRDVENANIAKLAYRFPDAFDAALAAGVRNVDGERQAIVRSLYGIAPDQVEVGITLETVEADAAQA
jgi:hypothetical protein